MTEKDVKKLVELQQNIEQLKKIAKLLREYEFRVTFPNYSNYEYLPFHLIPELEEQTKYLFTEMVDERLQELEGKLNTLTLCKQIPGGPSYTPTELE